MLSGKKTYILTATAFVSALALYIQDVVANGFEVNHLLAFISGTAVTAAIAALRSAIAKK